MAHQAPSRLGEEEGLHELTGLLISIISSRAIFYPTAEVHL